VRPPPPQSVGSGSPTEHPRRNITTGHRRRRTQLSKRPGAATPPNVCTPPPQSTPSSMPSRGPSAYAAPRSAGPPAATTPTRTSTAANDTLLSTRLGCYLVVAVTARTCCGADWADARLGQQGALSCDVQSQPARGCGQRRDHGVDPAMEPPKGQAWRLVGDRRRRDRGRLGRTPPFLGTPALGRLRPTPFRNHSDRPARPPAGLAETTSPVIDASAERRF
jgi:hypothetical protein